MNGQATTSIDPRAWLLWGLAASLVPLTGRNPIPLFELLLIVLVVRSSLPKQTGWSQIIRLSIILVAIGVVFNVLTVRSGNSILFNVPNWAPVLKGPVTWNALIYGLLSGLAIITLVLIGVTVTSVLDWTALLRILPDSLLGLGVAGSVAFSFLPQMVQTYHDVTDAHAVRGHRLRGVRDYASLAPALLSGGIERAITLSALLESRAFGSRTQTSANRGFLTSIAVVAGLTLTCSSAYLFAVARPGPAVLCLIAGSLAFLAVWSRGDRRGASRTKYRKLDWQPTDTAVGAGAIVAMLSVVVSLRLEPVSIRYEPYPSIELPFVSVWLIVGLMSLIAPAIILVRAERQRS